MSLAYLKSLLAPSPRRRNGTQSYSPLPQYNPTASTSSPAPSPPSTPTTTNEKPVDPPSPSTLKISPRTLSNLTLGLSDGLTVPFALTAGLSTLNSTHVVIYGGLAELVAGAISMGLGGYLGARSEADAGERARGEVRGLVRRGGGEAELRGVLGECGVGDVEGVVGALIAGRAGEDGVVEVLARLKGLGASCEGAGRGEAWKGGLEVAAGYFGGGLVPLVPYLVFGGLGEAFVGSCVVMVAVLFVFGWVKTRLVGEEGGWVCAGQGVQMVVMGSLAAGAAMGCVKAIGG